MGWVLHVTADREGNPVVAQQLLHQDLIRPA